MVGRCSLVARWPGSNLPEGGSAQLKAAWLGMMMSRGSMATWQGGREACGSEAPDPSVRLSNDEACR